VESAPLSCLAAAVVKYQMSPWTNTTKPCQSQCLLAPQRFAPQHFEATITISLCHLQRLTPNSYMDHLEQAKIAVTHESLIHNRLEVSAFVLLLKFFFAKSVIM